MAKSLPINAQTFREVYNDYAQTGVVELPEIMDFPRRKAHSDDDQTLVQQIVMELYPTIERTDGQFALSALIKYDKDFRHLRSAYLTHVAKTEEERIAFKKKDSIYIHNLITAQGPWNASSDPISAPPSTPMPVVISDIESLQPFFDFIRGEANMEGIKGLEPYYNVPIIEYPKGVVYEDGRIDLCKQVLGPEHIYKCMDALADNQHIRHFLLGNNIIGPKGTDAIRNFVAAHPDRFQTLYLAGNCITAQALQRLAEALFDSPVLHSLWLKRNPLSPHSGEVLANLVIHCQQLSTLDFDQTELQDAGVASFFNTLRRNSRHRSTLKTIYMNGVGAGIEAARAIGAFLSDDSMCGLEDMFMSCNGFSLDASDALAAGIRQNKTLKRLSLASCGLIPESANLILEACQQHPTLISLSLGQSYATKDLNCRYNWLDDTCADQIVALIQNSSSLRNFTLDICPMSKSTQEKISDAVFDSRTLLYFFMEPLQSWPQYIPIMTQALRNHLVTNAQVYFNDPNLTWAHFMAEHLRFIRNSTAVRFIDSVYRNRASQLARQGKIVLDKYWADGDDTLTQVLQA